MSKSRNCKDLFNIVLLMENYKKLQTQRLNHLVYLEEEVSIRMLVKLNQE